MRGARRTTVVVLAAVLGIALAAAITWSTSQLVRQRIGLASEPLTAGSRLLAPASSTPVATSRAPTGRGSGRSTPSQTRSVPQAPATAPSAPAPPSEASSSSQTSSAPAEATVGALPPPVLRGSAGDGGGDSRPRRDD